MTAVSVTEVTCRTYELPMPQPWGPGATSQFLTAATVRTSDGQAGPPAWRPTR